MMAHIGELAQEKQASIPAEDWERMYRIGGVEYLL
jgi:hypothetical protein